MDNDRDVGSSGSGDPSNGDPSNGDPVDGERGGLPPQAPGYDFRTGQPLDRPLEPFGSGSGPDEDDLGIWAPGGQEAEDAKGAGYDYGTTNASPSGSTYGQPPPERTAVEAAQYGQVEYGQVGYTQPSYTTPTGPGPGSYPGYGPVGSPPTLTGPPPGPGPGRSRRGLAVLGGVAGVLVVAVAVLVTVLLVGGSSGDKPATASSGPSTVPSGGAPSGSLPGGTGPSPGTGSTGGPDAARASFVRTVDGILNQSASGRSQVAAAVNGVTNGCSTSPASAATSMQQVIDNRASVLSQANALSAPDAATAAVKANLIRALQASIEANQGYLQWFEDLQSTYPDASPAGCPNGRAPTDSNYDDATAASGRATSAKQAFVAGYNPLATAAGQRTWSESEF